jgi:hypothetical protein
MQRIKDAIWDMALLSFTPEDTALVALCCECCSPLRRAQLAATHLTAGCLATRGFDPSQVSK